MQSFRTEIENPIVERDIIDLEKKIALYYEGKIDEERFRSLRLARGVYGQRQFGVQMIRIKLPYGRITSEQLHRIANVSDALGYSRTEYANVPEGSNMGIGCGNPQAIASLKQGETVLDLGSGGGFDCFLASKSVGERGKVIGVDMTAEMISKARNNAKKGHYNNTEFRLGEIEHLPVADATIDVIISNCVINLSPEKGKVFNEAYRVLKPGRVAAIHVKDRIQYSYQNGTSFTTISDFTAETSMHFQKQNWCQLKKLLTQKKGSS